jgi:hypothetical protein
MLPLPSPPTDNVYKFASIAGLLLLAIGLVLPSFIEQDRVENTFKLVKEAQERRIDYIFKLVEVVQKDKFIDSEEKLKKEMTRIDDSLREMMAKDGHLLNAEIDRRNRITEKRLADLLYVRTIGALLMAVGFVLWYFRVQRHQDRILKAEVVKAETTKEEEKGKSAISPRKQ